MLEKKELVRKAFPFLEKELVDEICEAARIIEATEGDNILDEGDYIRSFPMVISGTIRVTRFSDQGNELLLYYLKAGETCAMSLTCCMSLQKSNIRMVAEEPSVVITIPVEMPERWMTEFRTWKEFMMYSYRKRFDELLDTIDAVAFMSLDERLVRFFSDRFRSTGKTVYEGTHLDIAIQLNSSREVISRLLKTLEKRGLVTTGRNSVDYTMLVRH
ncbi:MAG: Crp/Fnr family transcriptional regulator [Bacteroidales bacterium]